MSKSLCRWRWERLAVAVVDVLLMDLRHSPPSRPVVERIARLTAEASDYAADLRDLTCLVLLHAERP